MVKHTVTGTKTGKQVPFYRANEVVQQLLSCLHFLGIATSNLQDRNVITTSSSRYKVGAPPNEVFHHSLVRPGAGGFLCLAIVPERQSD